MSMAVKNLQGKAGAISASTHTKCYKIRYSGIYLTKYL